MPHVSVAAVVPPEVYKLPLGERIVWARKRSKLSHDRIVARLGRSNRGHLIKIEKGVHVPRDEFRAALADALAVPRELFADDPQEAAPLGATFRGSRGSAATNGGADGASGAGADAVTERRSSASISGRTGSVAVTPRHRASVPPTSTSGTGRPHPSIRPPRPPLLWRPETGAATEVIVPNEYDNGSHH